MTSKRDSRCFVLALTPDASASTRLPCIAYINVSLSTFLLVLLNYVRCSKCFSNPRDGSFFIFCSNREAAITEYLYKC